MHHCMNLQVKTSKKGNNNENLPRIRIARKKRQVAPSKKQQHN